MGLSDESKNIPKYLVSVNVSYQYMLKVCCRARGLVGILLCLYGKLEATSTPKRVMMRRHQESECGE